MDISKINNAYIDNSISTAKSATSDANFENSLLEAMKQKDEVALKEACCQFETIFLQMMYKQMKASIPKSTLIPEDSGTEYFEGMLDDYLMENASTTNALGLGDMMYKQLSKQMKYDE